MKFLERPGSGGQVIRSFRSPARFRRTPQRGLPNPRWCCTVRATPPRVALPTAGVWSGQADGRFGPLCFNTTPNAGCPPHAGAVLLGQSSPRVVLPTAGLKTGGHADGRVGKGHAHDYQRGPPTCAATSPSFGQFPPRAVSSRDGNPTVHARTSTMSGRVLHPVSLCDTAAEVRFPSVSNPVSGPSALSC